MSNDKIGAAKSILITGCSKDGLGYELAKSMFAAGWIARDMPKLEGLAPGILRVELDLIDAASVGRAAEKALALSHGRVDVIVHNAGVKILVPLIEQTQRQIAEQSRLALDGPLLLTQALIRPLVDHGDGQLVSKSGRRGISVLKAAHHALSDALRAELRPFGVDVKVLRLGAVNTQLFKDVQDLPSTSLYAKAADLPRRTLKSFLAMKPIEVTLASDWLASRIVAGDAKNYEYFGPSARLMGLAYYFKRDLLPNLVAKRHGLGRVETSQAIARHGKRY
ncbi:NAD(P)-binding protein [Ceraceosorus guamensis]|uniref:NAD(P)-binding protein n=1 Tax=Ceraceosorus guamensis TaxID=1522189 RepID=A0A316W4Y3_9BASI|nr:NAD(P)-binding protein [Ceraceosorus guamensis]PWN44634.1 NAD(P)-binding protein [Ceraceosorus guamensis]